MGKLNPLFRLAVTKNALQSIQHYIDRGYDLNATDGNGITLLMIAVMRKHIDAVRILLSAGADLKILDENGNDALSYAIKLGCPELIDILTRFNSETFPDDLGSNPNRKGDLEKFGEYPDENISTINAQISCESLSKMFEKPKLSLSDKGFIEDDPHKLARILAKLDVASTSVDDVVKLQISEYTLEASINTETAVADLRINIKKAGGKNFGPAVEVKRLLLIACLKSFPQGQFVRIHGLLTDDPNIVIQSTVNNDFVVIAKMQHVDQAAA